MAFKPMTSQSKVGPILLFTLSVVVASSQQLSQNELDTIATTPTNEWQQQPRPSKALPFTQSERQIRFLRDSYADKIIGVGMPVEQLKKAGVGYGRSRHGLLPTGRNGLIPPYPDEVVIIGMFASYDEVLTQSHLAIYSEIHVSVEQSLFPSNFSAPAQLDIITSGGSVRISSGETLAFDNKPKPFGLEPNQRYVLFLRHVDEGDFYLLYDSIKLSAALPSQILSIRLSRLEEISGLSPD